MLPNRYSDPSNSNHSISNHSIIVTAVSCLSALVFVVGVVTLWSIVTRSPPEPVVESVPDEGRAHGNAAEFDEGYSMMLPPGFVQESREETKRGYVVYRFRAEEGYRFTLAVIPADPMDQFTKLPQNYSQALVKSVPELSEGVDGEVQSERVAVDGMPAAVFRFYEKETYRGVTFTYFMVAKDRDRRLVLKFFGKHGAQDEREESVVMPNEWYKSLLTLRHVRPLRAPARSATDVGF